MDGNVTQEVWDALEKLYADLDKVINLIGLDYDDEGELICTNSDQVDPEWCDEDLLSSIDTLSADLGYFLGK